MKRYTIDGLERISKATARKLYNQGIPVYACPCKLRPGRPWNPEVQYPFPPDPGATFDALDSAATYYKCGADAGNRLTYYTAEGIVK